MSSSASSLVPIILQPFPQSPCPSAENCFIGQYQQMWWVLGWTHPITKRPGFLSPGAVSFSITLSGHSRSLGVDVEAKRAERGRALGRFTEDEPWAWSQGPALPLLSL